MRRVVIRFFGGIGNQLFMYAAGKALAERECRELVGDFVSGFATDRRFARRYSLDQLGIRITEAGKRELFQFPFGRAARWMLRASSRYQRPISRRYLTDLGNDRGRELFQVHKESQVVWLEGYWQVAEIADAIAPKLKRELRPSVQDSGRVLEKQNLVQAEKTCVLCVRMFQESSGKDPGEMIQEDYYRAAMSRMKTEFGCRRFIVVSNDPSLAMTVLPVGENYEVIDPDNRVGGDVDDFAILQASRRMILSNSTFHWWAGWSAEQANSCSVIAPNIERWAGNVGFFPSRWLQV